MGNDQDVTGEDQAAETEEEQTVSRTRPGRPTIYSPELAWRVCEMVANGPRGRDLRDGWMETAAHGI